MAASYRQVRRDTPRLPYNPMPIFNTQQGRESQCSNLQVPSIIDNHQLLFIKMRPTIDYEMIADSHP